VGVNAAGSGRRGVARGYEVEVVECPVTTLDKLLADVDRRIDFAKMDIEGAQYHALLGGRSA
jgi:hypothetical protein